MIMLLSLILIFLGIGGLYRISEKQIKKTRLSKWSMLAMYPQTTRFVSLLLLILAVFILVQKEGFSIGFISFWIFSTPLIFIIILYMNELKPHQK